MDIIVFAKYVPNIDRIPANAWDYEKGTLLRSRLQMHFNSYDQVALNMALSIRQQRSDVRIKVLSMGPLSATDMLKEAIAYGADQAFLLTDKKFAGADTIATAYTLSEGIKYLQSTGEISHEYAVICGMQSPDGDTAQVPAQVAYYLDAPLYPYVTDLTMNDKEFSFHCLNTVGAMTITTSQFPLVATATKLYKKLAFYVSLDDMVRANNTPISLITVDDMSLDVNRIGLSGSKTRVIKIFSPEKQEKERKVLDSRKDNFKSEITDIIRSQIRLFGQSAEQTDSGAASEQLDTSASYYSGDCVSLCEIVDGRLSQSSLEISCRCVQLAQQLGVNAMAVIVSKTDVEVAQILQTYGITKVVFIENLDEDSICVHDRARAIAAVLKDLKPQIVIASATLTGRVIAPYISAELNSGLTADCSALELRDAVLKKETYSNILHQTRPALGGNIMATIVSIYDNTEDYVPPQMATVRPGVLDAVEAPAESCEVVTVSALPYKLNFSETYMPHQVQQDDEQADLTSFEVIVCVGNAVDTPESVDQIIRPFCRQLERVLNTPVGLGCTRAIVDKGILPHNHQIGQTGVVIKPKLYIGIGVSGAIQHKIGMEQAEMILSINTNPEAPLNSFSDVVFLGDYEKVIEQFSSQLSQLSVQ